MAENGMTEIRAYLAKDAAPITMKEFTEFWRSLTEEEKAEYKAADLSK